MSLPTHSYSDAAVKLPGMNLTLHHNTSITPLRFLILNTQHNS